MSEELMKINLLVADDHAVIREGIAAILKGSEIEVVAEAETGNQAIEQAMKLKPDYVVIQFGHNDEPGKPGRSTDANTEYRASMTRYVDDAIAVGVKPILVTSIARRQDATA